jgi:translation initiation factor RLI1
MKERYKHFIIFGPSMCGKTKLAKHITDIFNGLYVDMLENFQKDTSKKDVIDIFGPSKLIAYIKGIGINDNRLIIIDQIDFIINTWDDSQFREFLVFVDQNQSEECYMFIMHNYRILERETPIKDNDKGHKRLINIYNIQQGGSING